MADSQAIIWNGGTFWRADQTGTAPTTFTKLAEITDIVPGAGTAPDIDVSHSESTAREKRGGLPDFGEMTVTGNLLPGNTVQQDMEDEAGLNVVRQYRVVHSGGNVNTGPGRRFSLILKTFGTTGYVVDGKLQFVATFAVSGKPVRLS